MQTILLIVFRYQLGVITASYVQYSLLYNVVLSKLSEILRKMMLLSVESHVSLSVFVRKFFGCS